MAPKVPKILSRTNLVGFLSGNEKNENGPENFVGIPNDEIFPPIFILGETPPLVLLLDQAFFRPDRAGWVSG